MKIHLLVSLVIFGSYMTHLVAQESKTGVDVNAFYGYTGPLTLRPYYENEDFIYFNGTTSIRSHQAGFKVGAFHKIEENFLVKGNFTGRFYSAGMDMTIPESEDPNILNPQTGKTSNLAEQGGYFEIDHYAFEFATAYRVHSKWLYIEFELGMSLGFHAFDQFELSNETYVEEEIISTISYFIIRDRALTLDPFAGISLNRHLNDFVDLSLGVRYVNSWRESLRGFYHVNVNSGEYQGTFTRTNTRLDLAIGIRYKL